MKVKCSITMSKQLLRGVDKYAGPRGNRSAVVELAVKQFLERERRNERNRRDLALIDKYADELNAEAAALTEVVKPWP